MAIVTCGARALPRDLDVNVQVSKPQVEQTTDLSVTVGVVNDADFDHDANRIRYYTSLAAVADDFADTTEAYKMATAFFAQTPRALRFAIAKAFTTAQAAFFVGGDLPAYTAFTSVSNGSFTISIDGDEQDITGLDFSLATDLDDVAAVIQTALQAVATGGYTSATAVVVNNTLRITSGTTGDASTITVLTPVSPATGTDISGPTFLNGLQGTARAVDGYTPTGIVGELDLIAEAARCSGRFVYGWTLEKAYRNVTDQEAASGWAQARTAIMALTSNSVQAYDAAVTTDIGSVLEASGDFRTTLFWSDKPDEYPDVALLSYVLHVDYAAEGSTITAKFKNLVGITTAGISETQLGVLQSKRYNVFTRVGNNSRTVRDGVEADPNWYIDDLVNLDNFKEELQVNVYNVFLREKKVPYTVNGVTLLEDACDQICRRYVLNGTFAARPVLDDTRKSGVRIDPAYTITSTALELITAAERAARVGPPITIDGNLAGAIHSVNIGVNAFN